MSEDSSSVTAFIEAVDLKSTITEVSYNSEDNSPHLLTADRSEVLNYDPSLLVGGFTRYVEPTVSIREVDCELVLFNEVTPHIFRQAVINATKHSDLYAQNLDVKPDYDGYNCWLSEDGLSGYAVSVFGEITNVFSIEKGRGHMLMDHLMGEVAELYDYLSLNCFDGMLTRFYEFFGFTEVDRTPNHDEQGPDVVFMEYNRDL